MFNHSRSPQIISDIVKIIQTGCAMVPVAVNIPERHRETGPNQAQLATAFGVLQISKIAGVMHRDKSSIDGRSQMPRTLRAGHVKQKRLDASARSRSNTRNEAERGVSSSFSSKANASATPSDALKSRPSDVLR